MPCATLNFKISSARTRQSSVQGTSQPIDIETARFKFRQVKFADGTFLGFHLPQTFTVNVLRKNRLPVTRGHQYVT